MKTTTTRLANTFQGYAAAAGAALAILTTQAQATPFTWTQNSVSVQSWTSDGNWLDALVYTSAPQNELIFFANTTAALANGSNDITADVPPALAMNTLTLNGRGNTGSASSATVRVAHPLDAPSTWTIGDATASAVNLNGVNNLSNGTRWSGLSLNYDVGANLSLNQPVTTFSGSGTAEFLFSGNISQTAAGSAITKDGTSNLTLSGTSSYTGGTSVNGGALIFRTLESKAPSGTHTFAAGTTLGLGVGPGGFTTADVDNAFAGTMTGNLANVTRTATTNIGIDTTAGDINYSSSIPGSPANGLVKLGSKTLTLTGTSTYTGPTILLGGTLAVDSLANGGAPSRIGVAPAGPDGLVINGGVFSYTGATTTTDRGFTAAGNTNSAIVVAGENVALTLGACSFLHAPAFSANPQAITFDGGAGSSLTLGPITASTTASQMNLDCRIPTTLGPVTYLHTATQFVIANRGTSTLTYGDITGPGSTQPLFLGNQGTFNGVISGFTGNCIIGAGGSTVKLLGANTFTGVVDIRQNGTIVEFNSIRNVNGGPSALGAPVTAAGGTILFGQGVNSMTLRYIGTGDTSDRILRLNGTTGTVTLDQSGTGLLKFTSALTAGAGSKTLMLAGSTAGSGEIGGAIVDNSASNTTSVTKTGSGTWTLSGANTYTGTTMVEEGTLSLVGGSQASPVFVNFDAILGFKVGSPTNSSSSVDFAIGSKVRVTGTVDNVTDYRLMTAAVGITGVPVLDPLIPGYTLEIREGGTQLWLAADAGGTPYEVWSGGELFIEDKNGDGVKNGLAFLLGAADADADARALLPSVAHLPGPTGGLRLTFSLRKPAARGAAQATLEWSQNLGITDPWLDNQAVVPDATSVVNGVDFQIDTTGPLNVVTATIPSTEGAGGKLFSRLTATEE